MKKTLSIMLLAMLVLNFVIIGYAYCDANSEIKSAGGRILNAIMWFGYAISVAMVVFIGIKYILGAADAKANMKSAITSWLIGAFIVFGASTVIAIVTSVLNVNTTTESNGPGLAETIVDTGYNKGTNP